MSESLSHDNQPTSASEHEVPARYERELEPNEKVMIDTSAWLSTPEETKQKLDVYGPVLAEINAGGKLFLLIDTTDDAEFNTDYLVIDRSYPGDPTQGYKGIYYHKPVTFGRTHYKDRFNYPQTTADDHFVVTDDGDVSVKNLTPKYGTILTTPLPDVQAVNKYNNIKDNRTIISVDRVRRHVNYGEMEAATAPYGTYLNHPILGRKSPEIANGVYMGGGEREAIVVDDRSKRVVEVTNAIVRSMRSDFENRQSSSTQTKLTKIMNHVQNVMRYDGRATEQLSAAYAHDQLVGLSTYIEAGVGVCRHQGLLAALIAERLVKAGLLQGAVSIERNTVIDADRGGTHAWATYRDAQNTYVIDPAQSFVGTKEQARREKRWQYDLNSDM